ncbi:MAG: hypothetical protein Q8M24_06930 [Pseudolabrys sp.]|nr:hypothetical protein [Pseudolabrys sp.]
MADYYPLIARAVAGLDKNTGENRRALYERARSALVNQLRGVDPPLDESDITRERLALEEAIRKLELEAAKRARAEPAEPDDGQPSLRDQGLRDFRDTVAEAQNLGDASAEASRSARAAYEETQGEPPPPAAEDERPLGDDHDPAAPQDHDHAHEHLADTVRADDGEHYFEPPASEQPELADAANTDAAHLPEMAEQPHPAHDDLPPPPRAATYRGQPAQPDDDDAYTRPVRNYGRMVKIALVLLLLGAVGAAGYWQRSAVMNVASSTFAALRGLLATTTPATTPATAPKPATTAEPAGRPKIADRIGNDTAPTSPATAPAAAVAQKVVLYDEDPNDPKGRRYVGSAVWRTETVSPGPGLAPELAIRADVDIPERRMRMTWSLRRNTDKALPASHTIEIMFTLPADFADGGVGNVPGVLMKQNEQARGVPLAGLAVKVTNGYFLIGLSAVEIDKERNISLLKERDWFDIPLVYTNGNKRAILAVEKGTPGGRAFEEAFRAWGQ